MHEAKATQTDLGIHFNLDENSLITPHSAITYFRARHIGIADTLVFLGIAGAGGIRRTQKELDFRIDQKLTENGVYLRHEDTLYIYDWTTADAGIT